MGITGGVVTMEIVEQEYQAYIAMSYHTQLLTVVEKTCKVHLAQLTLLGITKDML